MIMIPIRRKRPVALPSKYEASIAAQESYKKFFAVVGPHEVSLSYFLMPLLSQKNGPSSSASWPVNLRNGRY
jgi:hypothetical protein